jgi:hypothetical protein
MCPRHTLRSWVAIEATGFRMLMRMPFESMVRVARDGTLSGVRRAERDLNLLLTEGLLWESRRQT